MPDFTAQALSLVNTTTAGDQAPPLVAGLAGGGYVVSWFSSADQNVYAQQYDAAGNRVGGETFVAHAGTASGVAGLAGGGYVVLFTEGGPGGASSVLAQRMDASGHAVGGPTVVAASTNGSAPLSGDNVEALPDGGWLVTFHSEALPPTPIESGTLYAQRFDASGAAAGGQLTLAQTSGNLHTSTAVLPDGEWVTTYNQFANYHDGLVAATAQFSAAGVAEHASTINPTPSSEVAPAVAVLASGHEAVVWFTPDQQPTWYHLQGQLFDASGAPLGPAFDLANAQGLLVGSVPQVTALADGGFVVSWEHSALVSASTSGPSTYSFDLHAQYFDANGNASGGAIQVGPTTTVATTSPPTMQWSVTATPDGGFVVAVDEPGNGLDVYAQKFSPAGAASAPPGGTSGNDTLTVPSGTATIDFGAGTDTAVFDASVASVQSYAIANGVLNITTASGSDTLVNVERVRFADALFGLDTQAPSGSDPGGHVWQAAAVFHAGFGALPGLSDLSRWTADADHAGSMAAMAQDMVNAYAPGVSSGDLVTYLYQQLAHAQPSAETVQSYVDQIGPGHQFATQGDLVAWAASLPVNADAIAGIVGSAQPLAAAWF
jgi:hypothetical protein